MALNRVKVWGRERLKFADLNAALDNIHNNALSLISPLTGNLDCGGYKLTNTGAGTAGSPSVQVGATDTGIWSNAASTELDFSIAGTNLVSISVADPGTVAFEGISAGPNGPVLQLQHKSPSQANGDTGGIIQFRNYDSGGIIRIIGVIAVSHDDITAASQDSAMNFQVQNAVNAGDVNTIAVLSSLGVWTDASAAANKRYVSDVSDSLSKLKQIKTLGVYVGANTPQNKMDRAERHFSPTAEEFFQVFGLGRDPAHSPPGIAAKDVAWLAIKGLLELESRVSTLEGGK